MIGAAFPVVALAAVAAALGAALLALSPGGRPGGTAVGEDRTGTAATALVAGLVVLFGLLLVLHGAGIPWRRVTVAAASLAVFGALTGAALWRGWRPVRRVRDLADDLGGGWSPPGWGDGVAAAALGILVWGVTHRGVAIPDFIYHWGIKGKHFHLAGGLDLALLADPLKPVHHPDYPWLLPSLYGVTAHVRGYFDERSMLLWTVVFLALLVAFARSALVRGGVGGGWLQAGTALVALVVVAFSVGYELAGGGDPVLALALVAAVPALVVRRGSAVQGGGAEALRRLHGDDLRLGMVAALAATAKIEGVPLAGFLLLTRLLVTSPVAVGTGRPAGRELGALLKRLPRLVLPSVAVVVPWMVTALRLDLFGQRETGSLDPGRLAEVVPAGVRALATPEWYGFPWLLLLLPGLLASRRLRGAAAVVMAQGGFYLLVYLSTPVDTTFYVLSSLPRLLFHLVPVVLVLLVLGLAPARPRADGGGEESGVPVGPPQ